MAAVESLLLVIVPVQFEVSPKKSVDVLTAQVQVGGDRTLTHFRRTGGISVAMRYTTVGLLLFAGLLLVTDHNSFHLLQRTLGWILGTKHVPGEESLMASLYSPDEDSGRGGVVGTRR